MMLSRKSVIKHSAAVQISNSINLIQRRAWNILLANAYYDLPEKEIFEVDYDEYMQALGIGKRRNRKYVEEYLGDLISTRVEWNVLGKVSGEDWESEWGATGLLASAVIKKVQGKKKIFYSYSIELRRRLYNPRLYARISLSMQNKFSSKHALALYEICVDYFIAKKCHGQSPLILIEDYRKIMGIKEGEYKEFKFLKQWVIKKPLLEINNKSDLLVRVTYKKEQRRIVALRIFIKPQKTNPALLLNRPAAKSNNMELSQRLQKYFHLTSFQASEVLTTHKQEDILENLKYVEKQIKGGNVKSIGAYTISAIKKDYRILPDLFAMENAEKNKAIKDAENKKRFREQLGRQYDEQKEQIIKKLEGEYSKNTLLQLKDEATKQIEKRHGKDVRVLSLLSRKLYHRKLVESSGVPCREEWIEKRMLP